MSPVIYSRYIYIYKSIRSGIFDPFDNTKVSKIHNTDATFKTDIARKNTHQIISTLR